MSRLIYQRQYEKIRQETLDDSSHVNDSSRLVAFMDRYIEVIKNESPLVEWEKTVWEKGLWFGLFFMFSFFFMVTLTVYIYLGDEEVGIMLGGGFLSMILLISLLICYPEKHDYKITDTGIYFRGYKRGKRFRQGAFKMIMIVCVPIFLFLLFYGGPTIFAGAGAGALGIFALPAMMKEKKPIEMALPWEAIAIYGEFKQNTIFSKKKMFMIQYYMNIWCDGELTKTVEKIIKEKMRKDCIYTTDFFAEGESNEYIRVEEVLMKETPFLWTPYPGYTNTFL
ncbi:hypothetical protein KDD30_18595 (plasmid) [Photobacterium sp. GJ3]|uniref:hypothetical protein n=1 Tax=Photobacterium sp. GJ3 TaxID=2829502 RepID=UPI001B8BE967|nr:hypothetical protein [Photobacterium sp. GJ3]QUJ70145.1 hypothetical protein KDD30_18595 [Photobacterium sp. GJ3]